MDANVLLTGATGFLGSHLATAVAASGRGLVVLKRSTSPTARIAGLSVPLYDADTGALARPFEEHRISAVIHAATCYGTSGEAPAQIVRANVQFPLELLDAAVRHGVTLFVNIDSLLPRNLGPYSLSKGHFADWLRVRHDGAKAANLRVELMYGPGDGRGKFVVSVLSRFLDNAPSLALTEGGHRRDFVYIDDVVRGIMTILDNEGALAPFTEFHIGTGIATSIRDFVTRARACAARLTGRGSSTRLEFGAVPCRPNEPEKVVADTRALRSLGWSPRISLDQGLALTVRWLAEQEPKP